MTKLLRSCGAKASPWWLAVMLLAAPVIGEDAASATRPTTDVSVTGPRTHPLDPALKFAREHLRYIETEVADYTATIIKRERIGNELKDYEFMQAKIRHRREENGRVTVPFSVYLKFLKPDSIKGREVIWVEGQNDNKIIAHESGLLGFQRFHLPPDGFFAMRGQRYPITEIGIMNLVKELIERGERERQHGDCEVKFYQNAKIDSYDCTLIEVIHPQRREPFDFYRARIYIDRTLRVPVHYAAWSWPEKPGGEPILLEEYTYRNIKLNVGLTDKDFDPENPEYAFP